MSSTTVITVASRQAPAAADYASSGGHRGASSRCWESEELSASRNPMRRPPTLVWDMTGSMNEPADEDSSAEELYGLPANSIRASVAGEAETPQLPHHVWGVNSEMATPTFAASDLIDNKVSKALSRPRRYSDISAHSMQVTTYMGFKGDNGRVDWSLPIHRKRLKSLRKLVRRLFLAIDLQECRGAQRSAKKDEQQVSPIKSLASRLVTHNAFVIFFVILIVFALFGPDVALLNGISVRNNSALATISTMVFCFFLVECMLNLWVTPGYGKSTRMWVDLIATLSMIGDTFLGNEFINNAAVAGRGSRFLRILRVGRSAKLARLARLGRTVQVLRLVPRIQGIVGQGNRDLALLLFYKRVWHVFQHIDEEATGKLTEVGREYLNTAMDIEFPAYLEEKESPWPVAVRAHTSRVRSFLSLALRTSWRNSTKPVSSENPDEDTSFNSIVHSLLCRPEGRVALQRCLADIDHMRDACVILDEVLARIIPKACMLIMLSIVIFSLLTLDYEDLSAELGLAQLTELARFTVVGTDMEALCALVRDYSANQEGELLLLVVHFSVYWGFQTSCPCCNRWRAVPPGLAPGGTQPLSAVPELVFDPVGVAEDRIGSLSFEVHEVALLCYPDVMCGGDAHSVAVLDIRSSVRADALAAILCTVVVVIMMVISVVLISNDMTRRFRGSIIHPLWDLIDDMCAIRCIEVVSESPSSLAPSHRTVFAKKSHQRSMCCICKEQERAVDEIEMLSRAFHHLRGALRAWLKYVPTILFQQLYDTGVEAGIGVDRCDVTVLFCGIRCFDELCAAARPRELLTVLGLVLNAIADVIADHNGTFLEFIGGEVMAVFNVPASVERHSLAAVEAALEFQERVAAIPKCGVVLQIGVHRAPVLAGNLGSATRMKYGLLGDGVNVAARIKSLNSRLRTGLLASSTALDFDDAHIEFITRPIGNLKLKGRTMSTMTYEVLAKRAGAPERVVNACEKHKKAFELFTRREFDHAKRIFADVPNLIAPTNGGIESFSLSSFPGDEPSRRLASLCDKYIQHPPPEHWDGTE